MSRTGKLFVISGPSGAGKGTLIARLLKEMPELELSVSATTRRPRAGESHKRDYIFMEVAEFERKVAEDAFLEWARVHGNLYGTLKKRVEDKLSVGTSVILEIDIQGADQIKRSFPAAVTVFICPPHLQELRRRLVQRNTDSRGAIEVRLNNAKDEINQLSRFDHSLINDEISRAATELAGIFRKEMNVDGQLRHG